MTVTPAELTALSRLLDEAMDLPVGEREAWLAGLPEADQPLAPMLREMLAEQSGQSGASRPDFLNALPRLGDEAASGEEFASAGDRVGPYRLIREIGRGGMGAVWLAEREDGTLQRQVALKLPRLAWGAGLAERMKRERDIGALLEHPNIARLYDAGVDPRGRPYLAFEHIAGQAIDSYCDAHGLGVPERLRLFNQVARAVAYAHGRLVVHRDIKPSNVLVTDDGQAHLLDFGIAKLLHDAADATMLTQEQGRVLTPHYASPEQVRGETITVVSDVYSLGVLLYQLLTGGLPYNPKRKTLGALEEAILEGEPPWASSRVAEGARVKVLRGELDAILAKALKREPGQRYQTVDALLDDIERHLSGERVLARPDSTWYRMSKVLRRNRLPFAVAGMTTLAVVLGAGIAVWQARKAQEAVERSRVVMDFVVEVFRVNAPGVPAENEVRQLPAEALLQRGAQLIATKFPGQPQLQVDLYGIVGGIFFEMGAPQLAAEYAKRHIDALRRIGASAVEEAQATIQLAQALLMQDQLKEAKLQTDRAVALAEHRPEVRLKALAVLTRVFDRLNKVEEAVAVADRIERELNGTTKPSSARAVAKWTRARLYGQSNRTEEAIVAGQSAIDEALAAEGPLSSTAIDIHLDFARSFVFLGRFDEAAVHRQAALAALRSAGGAGDIRAALEEAKLTRFLYRNGQIRFPEARKSLERNLATANSRGPLVPDSIKASVKFALGALYFYWGDLALADPMISSSAAILRATTESPSDILIYDDVQGGLAQDLGRHAEADRFLRKSLEFAKRANDQNPFAAWYYSNIAINLLWDERFDEAEALLASAPKYPDMRGQQAGSLPATSVVIQRSLAIAKFERGDAVLALAMLPPDEELIEQEVAEQQRVRGEILCTLGRRADALPLLESVQKFYEQDSYEHNPYLARIRSVIGLCVLANGQRKRASELAQLARSAFQAQPGVSPYFKRPLAKLEQLLQRRG